MIKVNKDSQEIVVVDYKVTSNKNLEDYTSSNKHYHKSYLRQLDFYSYLLKLNKFKVHETGYWSICNAETRENYFDEKIILKLLYLNISCVQNISKIF